MRKAMEKILLEPWEITHLRNGIEYLIQTHLSTPGALNNIPGDKLKSMSWLIAFQLRLDECKEEPEQPATYIDRPFRIMTR